MSNTDEKLIDGCVNFVSSLLIDTSTTVTAYLRRFIVVCSDVDDDRI